MRLALIVSTLLLSSAAGAATYYKWVDQNGVVQYGATPPKGVDAKPVKADARASRSDQEIAAAQNPAYVDPDAPVAPVDKAAQAKAAADREACAAARNNLQVLNANSVVTRIDPATKQQVPLSGEQIEAERVQANQEIAARCPQVEG